MTMDRRNTDWQRLGEEEGGLTLGFLPPRWAGLKLRAKEVE